MMNFKKIFSDRAKTAATSLIDDFFRKIIQQPGIISFAAGAPDISLLPSEIIDDLIKNAIRKYGKMILQYGLTQGFPPLEEAVLPLLAKRNIYCKSSDIHIGTGGSGTLNNICMALLNKKDFVLVENPTYSPAVKTFLSYEAKVSEVTCDSEGMLPDALENRLRRQKVKFVYLLPTFQNPTGRTMSLQRRKAIVKIVKKYNTLVIEDDVYYDLRYRGEDVPSVCSFASSNVIYLTSISKIFAPAMRIGITLMPKEILEKVLILKQGIDMQTSSFTQALTAEFLTSTYFKPHLKKINGTYSRKLKIMLSALDKYMPEGFIWNKPEGGMFLWVEGPEGFDSEKLLDKAIDIGVAFLPGNTFYIDTSKDRNTLRLSFANPPEDKIEEGVRLLAKCLKQYE